MHTTDEQIDRTTPQADSAESTITLLLELLEGTELTKFALEQLQENDPETLTIAYRLLSTGGEEARDNTEIVFNSITRRVLRAAEKRDTDPQWKDRFPDAWSPLNKENLLSQWHLTQLNKEIYDGKRPLSLSHGLALADVRKVLFPDGEGCEHTDAFWRGLAALYLTGNYSKHKEEVLPLIHYAGRHPDTPSVVNLSVENNTLDPEILEQLSKTHNALHNGVI